jgi:Alginate export
MLSLELSKSVSLSADSFFFRRQRASDGLYSQSGVFLRTGQYTPARYIGAEQNLDLVWRVDRHTSFQFIAAYYEVGPYLRQTPPPGRNATDFSAKMSYKF